MRVTTCRMYSTILSLMIVLIDESCYVGYPWVRISCKLITLVALDSLVILVLLRRCPVLLLMSIIIRHLIHACPHIGILSIHLVRMRSQLLNLVVIRCVLLVLRKIL